jgi:N-acetylmuramoyl-L-alanine amidase CwlA
MSRGYTSGAYDGILDNTNTISIELCGCNDGQDNGLIMNIAQETALYDVLRWIKEKCPNVKHFVRHYDIKHKPCPKYYVDHPEDWKQLKKYVEKVVFR